MNERRTGIDCQVGTSSNMIPVEGHCHGAERDKLGGC